MEAIDRIREALKAKTRGFRGPGSARQNVEVDPADVVALCDLVAEPDRVVNDLRKGSETACLKTRRRCGVVVYADDAFHLLEKAGG